MASNFAKIKDNRAAVSIAAVLLLMHAAFSQVAFAQDEAESANERYTWSAELVSFDQSSRMATLKARMDTRGDDDGILGELSEGDRIAIRWTGITWGAGISDISREGESQPSDGLVLPAEFVGTEMDGQYVLFRLPVPQGSVSQMEQLDAGAWVTATTPKSTSGIEQAVTEIRPYNDVS